MDNELYHYGVLGMKWGIRRYQNKDGTLTIAGKKRIEKDSDMYFYDRRRKENKLRDPVTNRKAVSSSDILKREADNFNNVVENERKRLLSEKNTLKKAGYIFKDNPDSDEQEHNDDLLSYLVHESSRVKEAQKIYTLKEVDVFSDALLSDMGLQNTKAAKAFVKECLIDNNPLVRTNLGLSRKSQSNVETADDKLLTERISRQFELGDKYGKTIRTNINKASYKTKSEKRDAINTAFGKKLREIDPVDDSALYDSVWQQWIFALDELD